MVSNERFAKNLSIAARYDQKVENFPVLLVGESKNPRAFAPGRKIFFFVTGGGRIRDQG